MDSANSDENPNKAYSPEEDERRDGQRTRTIYRLVHIGRSGDEGLARCRNISDGGVGLRLTMPVQLNDEITIAFSPTVELSGTVVWVNGNECGVKFSQPIDSQQLLSSTSAEARAEGVRPPRLNAGLPGTVSFEDKVRKTEVLDVSQRGAKLTHDGEFKPGLKVKIRLNAGIERDGVIRWSDDNFAGVYFIEPLSVDDLGSVERLKSEGQSNQSGKDELPPDDYDRSAGRS